LHDSIPELNSLYERRWFATLYAKVDVMDMTVVPGFYGHDRRIRTALLAEILHWLI